MGQVTELLLWIQKGLASGALPSLTLEMPAGVWPGA